MPGQASTPSFQDGAAAVTSTYVECLNDSNLVALYAGDGITEEGIHNAHALPSGEALGSHTQATGFVRGPLNLQLQNPSDEYRPGYILKLNSLYYEITGAVGDKREKNKVTMISPPVKKVINPIISTLLSTLGQVLESTKAGASSTLDCDVVNTRAGATGSFALSAWTDEYTTAVVPAGMTMASSTGIITLSTVAAGTYYLKVTYTETLTGKPTRKGVGHIIMTVT